MVSATGTYSKALLARLQVIRYMRQEMPREANYGRLDSRASIHGQHAAVIQASLYDSTDGMPYADRQLFYTWQPNPQPRQAERWMKQAVFDLTSAKKEARAYDGKFSSPEWTCFKCHQVNSCVVNFSIT
jgi:hypothetical protein